jgi:hypothetical protein
MTSHQNGCWSNHGVGTEIGSRQLAMFADVFVLGRGGDAHLLLDDDGMSRRRAAFGIEKDRMIEVPR